MQHRHVVTPLPPRTLARWLLWFTLGLPLGQLAAQWHLLSHRADAAVAGVVDPDAGAQPSACQQCLDAAAVAAGALPAAAVVVAAAQPDGEATPAASAGPITARRWPGYLGRAPPIAPR